MVVNSINFWIFFIIVLAIYFGLFRRSAIWQNITLLVASYVFYGMVSWKMCALLLIATGVFYYLGLTISKYNCDNEKKASRLTTLGVLLGLGMLFYFKYLDFFVGQFGELLSALGLKNNVNTFGIIMPLGISFFTFKLIAYVIEVHRETIQPSQDPIAFGTFIAFFPTIMSGPIDQPGKFLPQLDTARKFDYDGVADGLKRILWGMFLKMCIADQLSGYTSAVLGNYEHHNATSIILASILYAFQMYTDFAGYSDMAIGVGKIMGITITENFNRPIFAQNIAEYWRRWHISLTSWITQYVYMPLNLSFRNMGMWGIYLATLINTVAIGAWHGANWTYIVFGLYHAVLLIIITAVEKRRKSQEKKHGLKKKKWYKYSRIFLTFILVDIGMVLFQAASITDFFGIVQALSNGYGMLETNGMTTNLVTCLISIVILLVYEFKFNEDTEYCPKIGLLKNDYVRAVYYALFFILIMTFGGSATQFIYFQF